ncbi:MAG TPA: Txe/YoeB family addiction module toxin [Paludibacteraceae bacterium]|nr:Txe/YoeB family addiction module toxin [Paludibacteraceae bacterium]HOS37446.1 Txe/YoeB family addiction module toxin [Paludibacteraceae bacterium]HPK20348.1 Txe/YoeB family addiction module toxin [Paludibacteraceae bacterium]
MEIKYRLAFSEIADADIARWKKSGQKIIMSRISKLLEELEHHPMTGTVKPEQLRFNLSGKFSRRIDSKNRLVYDIDEKKRIVTIHSLFGHY